MKRCSSCKNSLSYNHFYRNKCIKDGYAGECKECCKNKNYGKILKCDSCENTFQIKHRNISKRKYLKCPNCVIKIRTDRNRTQNKYVIDKGYKREKRGIFVRRRILEEHLNRKLTKEEIVHHIDGNKFNNEICNLWITNLSNHTKAHKSLETLAMNLYKQGKIKFNRNLGIYEFV